MISTSPSGRAVHGRDDHADRLLRAADDHRPAGNRAESCSGAIAALRKAGLTVSDTAAERRPRTAWPSGPWPGPRPGGHLVAGQPAPSTWMSSRASPLPNLVGQNIGPSRAGRAEQHQLNVQQVTDQPARRASSSASPPPRAPRWRLARRRHRLVSNGPPEVQVPGILTGENVPAGAAASCSSLASRWTAAVRPRAEGLRGRPRRGRRRGQHDHRVLRRVLSVRVHAAAGPAV